jgi:hypothetical protein
LGFSEKSFKGSIASRSRVQLLRVQGSIASRSRFKCLRRSCFVPGSDGSRIQCLRRSIACGVQLLAAFNSFAFKGLIACGVQRFNSLKGLKGLKSSIFDVQYSIFDISGQAT